MTYEELVEVAARGMRPELWNAVTFSEIQSYGGEARLAHLKEMVREDIADALSALRAQGVAMVPREATGNMLSRGWARLDDDCTPSVIWSAMLAAGEIRPEEGA